MGNVGGIVGDVGANVCISEHVASGMHAQLHTAVVIY